MMVINIVHVFCFISIYIPTTTTLASLSLCHHIVNQWPLLWLLGKSCCQAVDFYTLSSESFGDEDSKSQCMPVANYNHAVYVSKLPYLGVKTMGVLGRKYGTFGC